MSVTYRTCRLWIGEDKHWKAHNGGQYNIADLTPQTERPHVYDDWGYISTTDLDPNNACKHLKLLADAILDSTAKEINTLKAQVEILEKQCRDFEKEFKDMDKLVATMTKEEELWDD